MSQLDLFHVDAGDGWYSVGFENKRGEGGGYLAWFASEEDAIAHASRLAGKQRSYEPRCEKYPGTPPFVSERIAAWSAAERGRDVTSPRPGIFFVDGARLRLSTDTGWEVRVTGVAPPHWNREWRVVPDERSLRNIRELIAGGNFHGYELRRKTERKSA